MGRVFSKLWIHIVFSTKDRSPWINGDFKRRLYRYMIHVISQKSGDVLEINGVEDHVHILIDLKPGESIARMVRVVKACSSFWVHQNYSGLRDFAWQRGYGVFSVSESQKHKVARYIANQVEHHRNSNHQREFRALIEHHGIPGEPA